MSLPIEWFGAIFATIVATMMAGVGCWGVFHAVNHLRHWPKVPARLVRYRITRNENRPMGQRFYYVVVRFEMPDGRTVTATSTSGYWRRRWPVGHTLHVRYNPENPRLVEVACFTDLWALPLTFLGLALMVIVVVRVLPSMSGFSWP